MIEVRAFNIYIFCPLSTGRQPLPLVSDSLLLEDEDNCSTETDLHVQSAVKSRDKSVMTPVEHVSSSERSSQVSGKVKPSAPSSSSHLLELGNESNAGLVLVNEKAGMKGVDLQKINKIINENSEGSKYYEHQKKSKEKLNKHVAEMKEKYYSYSDQEVRKAEKEVNHV